MSGSDYDGKDQDYMDLLNYVGAMKSVVLTSKGERDLLAQLNKELLDAIDNIAHIIHYQEHLSAQDKVVPHAFSSKLREDWVARMVEKGFVELAGDDE